MAKSQHSTPDLLWRVHALDFVQISGEWVDGADCPLGANISVFGKVLGRFAAAAIFVVVAVELMAHIVLCSKFAPSVSP